MSKFAAIKSVFSKVKSLEALLPPPLREVLSENGVGSYSRYTGFLIIAFTLGWTTYLVIKNHAFPDMTGPTLFISGGAGSQYAINQIKNVAAAAKSGIANNNIPVTVPPPAPGVVIAGGTNDVTQSA